MIKGCKLSEEHKEKIRIAKLGSKHSEETKLKIGEKSKGRKCSEKTRVKLSKAGKGRRLSNEQKEKLRILFSGANSYRWKGGVKKKNIALYDTYAHQISYVEKVRRDSDNYNWLQVKCTYCGKWYNPKRTDTMQRIRALNGTCSGENRLYCSNGCKQLCPIFNKSARSAEETNTKQLSREVQPELRQLVFERDGWTCKKCGSTKLLTCHHKEGILWEPLLSADIDMCITVCKECHKKIHQIEWCGYRDMQCTNIFKEKYI